jgi:hypothetical protein
MYTIQTNDMYDLHMPISNITMYQQGVYYPGIKLLNKFS